MEVEKQDLSAFSLILYLDSEHNLTFTKGILCRTYPNSFINLTGEFVTLRPLYQLGIQCLSLLPPQSMSFPQGPLTAGQLINGKTLVFLSLVTRANVSIIPLR